MGKINSLKSDHSILFIVILFVSGLLFFFPYLGSVHLFDWDEINFAESAREMIVTHDYHLVQINYEPFWEKPPLFFWLQAGAMHLFGINEFAARFPNALFGIISLMSFFLIGRKHKSARFGFLWSLAYLGSFLPHLYFKSGIIDPVFNYFIFMGIYFMYRDVTKEQWKWKYSFVILSGIFIGLATLTKGPVGLLVFLLVYFIYFLFKKFSSFPSVSRILIWLAFYIIVCLLWFGEEVAKNGLWFLQRFITYQIELFLEPVASHGEPFYYHFVVVFIGCFPISIIGLPILFGRIKGVKKEFPLLMKILFWTIMILFSLTTTKIVHYSSLSYMPLAFMAAFYLDELIQNKEKINTAVLYGVILMGLIFSSLLAALPYFANHPEIIEPYIRDEYAKANLNIKVEWQGWESLTGIFYFLLIILSAFFFAKKSNWKAITTLFYSTALCLFIYLITVVPKIEQYSQGPAIRFYQSLAGKDVYMWPVGFKSYAQYFYGQKPPEPKYGNNQLEYLLRGKIDRPAYFVVKINNKEFTDQCNDCTLLKQEGGFLFYERKPPE
ncbi:MAG TPA: glycosyltransferase family 39 protein [Ginsengibacter sp.]|nr:glycosyltransferase family 39 protein [Ginsengibacter sp.]HRP17067.1 glycosyltransferase family 39 protein [Ginsengibacter sp.]HRP44840.1 glycosyltransferase family 39 protein [Ginsengibacter sp.]